MADRPASPTFFSSELGNYENSSLLDSSFNFDINYMDSTSAQPDGNRSHGDLALASPSLQGGELPHNTDMSQYFPLPPTPVTPESNRWDFAKNQPPAPSGLPDLDGMDFGENSQSLAAWPGARMEQTLAEFPMRQPSPLTNLLTNGNMQTTTRGRHGQITPPSDSNPSSPLWKPTVPEPYQLSGGMDSPSAPSMQQRPTQNTISVEGNNSSSTFVASRKKSAANSPFAGGTPSGITRRKNPTRKASSGGNLSKEETEKRAKFLERNRIAASKCRQKKKEWFEQLNRDSHELFDIGNERKAIVKQLRHEIIQLKTEILTSNRCRCPGVVDYIKREASSITDRYYPDS